MKRVRIARIDLHLKGVAPATARQAATLIGSELASAFANRAVTPAGRGIINADRVMVGAGVEPRALAACIARRIADATRGD
jgi:hypothetical protein